jgi:hypothetical protein
LKQTHNYQGEPSGISPHTCPHARAPPLPPRWVRSKRKPCGCIHYARPPPGASAEAVPCLAPRPHALRCRSRLGKLSPSQVGAQCCRGGGRFGNRARHVHRAPCFGENLGETRGGQFINRGAGLLNPAPAEHPQLSQQPPHRLSHAARRARRPPARTTHHHRCSAAAAAAPSKQALPASKEPKYVQNSAPNATAVWGNGVPAGWALPAHGLSPLRLRFLLPPLVRRWAAVARCFAGRFSFLNRPTQTRPPPCAAGDFFYWRLYCAAGDFFFRTKKELRAAAAAAAACCCC